MITTPLTFPGTQVSCLNWFLMSRSYQTKRTLSPLTVVVHQAYHSHH